MAMPQAMALPVPALEPMFRVLPVLQRSDAGVPPTAVKAAERHISGPPYTFLTRLFCVGVTRGSGPTLSVGFDVHMRLQRAPTG